MPPTAVTRVLKDSFQEITLKPFRNAVTIHFHFEWKGKSS